MLIFFYNGSFFSSSLPIAVIIIILKGVFGNTIPIAWAAIADSRDRNYRFSFALSTVAYAIGYFILILAGKYINDLYANIFYISVYILLIFFCVRFFKDILSKPKIQTATLNLEAHHKIIKISKKVIKECNLILIDFKIKRIRQSLLAFAFWEISFYTILISHVDFKINQSAHIVEAMMIGYLLGIVVLKFATKVSDRIMIKLGYLVSFFSFFPYFILINFLNDLNNVLLICYFFNAIGNAFLCPTLFSILAKDRRIDEQGRSYGLLDSADVFGFFVASIAAVIYNMLGLPLIYIIVFSFVSFTTSWLFYGRFRDIKK